MRVLLYLKDGGLSLSVIGKGFSFFVIKEGFLARFSLSLAHTRDVVSLCPRAAEGAKGSAVRRLIQDADGFRTS